MTTIDQQRLPNLSEINRVSFSDLKGWVHDNHTEALSVFRTTAYTLGEACFAAVEQDDARAFFERNFVPCVVGDPPALVTGYYEPELDASLEPTVDFTAPIFKAPPELTEAAPWLSREDINSTGILKNRNLEIAWLRDEIEVFFLQVQGSGRLRFPDGSVCRVGFAAKNGQPYRSIGKDLIANGDINAANLSADAIKRWLRAHPSRVQSVLNRNPSFVFFRKIDTIPSDHGPIGTLGQPVTSMRTIAVDPKKQPLGLPVWLEGNELNRLMVAQDTGSAITGAQRADVFTGMGEVAGNLAGRMNQPGRLVTLFPRKWLSKP